MLLLLLLVAGVTNTLAQNVTVHPGNGNMLPALKSTGGDIFYAWQGFATWKHEQLSLTLTTGDSNNATVNANGQLETPANDIFATPTNSTGAARYLQIGKGRPYDTYVTFCLPEGYRFTGYTITFHRISYPTADGLTYMTSGRHRGELRWRNDNNGYSYSEISETSGSISFGETDKTFSYTSTTNTTEANPTSYCGGISKGTTEKYTISRNSTDMKNIIYFKLSSGSSSGRAFILLDQVELKFTAEHNYTTLIPPSGETGKTAMDISFRTGKMDYGVLENRTDYAGNSWNPDWSKTRISYDGTIYDMDANITLYEMGSTKTVSAGDNDFDGTAGEVVDYKDNGSISTAGDYFKLESSKHQGLTEATGDTAIYFLESPIWASKKATTSNPNPHKNPIGYRIVGATFNYAAGTASTYIPATFYIRYVDEGVTYGLNDFNTQFNLNYQTVWRIDEEGYIYYQDKYLAVSGEYIIIVDGKSNASTFEVVENDGVSQIRVEGSTNQYIGWRKTQGSDGDDVWIPVVTDDPTYICFYDEQTPSSGGSHGKYTFLIYDKTGTYVLERKVVDGEGGTVEVNGYNNDAIKIGVIGTALIAGSLKMQALDPYIDRLRIVCEEQGGNGGKVSQQFNATNFSVKGGPFTFYVPTSFTGNAKFTFDDLYSKYGDETYYNATSSTNHARYFFVGSEYGDYDNSDVYDRYKNSAHRNASYTTKIACLQPGDRKYTFNNAATVALTAGNEFEEYPFSKALYQTKESGQFTDFIFPSTSMNGTTTKTAYLFTCDETRYNIAPTTATQHVYYAFYQMDIKMNRKNYTPRFTWTQVYDHTCYNNGISTAVIDKPQYGVKLGTTVASDEGDPNGYLTVSQVKNAITTITGIVQNKGKALTDDNRQFDINNDGAINNNDLVATNSNVDAPESTEQILYIDGSELLSIVEDKQNNQEMTLDKLREGLGDNALVYLPKGTTSEYSNIAYKTYGDIFWGADNFELIDMRPFYAPYDITIDQEKMITYKRSITVPKNGKVTSASIIMPFEIDLTNAPFTLHQMQTTNCLNGTEDEVYFPDLSSSVSKAEANTPYLLKVTNPGTDDIYSFVLEQSGTTIKATTGMVSSGDLKYTFQGETGNGAKDGKAIQFVNHGSYAGKQLAYDGYYFYFSKNMFLRSNDYIYKGTIKIAPFRTFYSATGEGRAKLASFGLIFDEGIGDDPTGISSLDNNPDLMVVPGNGAITMTSTIEQYVRVNSVSGVLVNNAKLQAGETQTINVPAGVYVINGVKIIVK